jgi:NAD-dependent DNA ligase
MKLGIGAEVEIIRSNLVIPQIVRTLSIPEMVFPIPPKCPICRGKVELIDRDIVCISPDCPAKIKNGIIWRIFELSIVDGIGRKNFDKLCVEFSISNLASFKSFLKKVTLKDLVSRGLGDKTSEKIFNIRNNILNRKWSIKDVLYSANIPKLGEVSIQNINDNISKEEFLQRIDSGTTLGAWDKYISTQNGTFFLDKCRPTVIKILQFIDYKINSDIAFKETKEILTITGSLSMSRNKFLERISSLGYKEGPISQAKFLICNAKTSKSSKYISAKKLGKLILTEEEFFKCF